MLDARAPTIAHDAAFRHVEPIQRIYIYIYSYYEMKYINIYVYYLKVG